MSSSRMTSKPRQPRNGAVQRRLTKGQHRPANRQVRWQSSQPSMGQNPFMMEDFDDIPVALRESDVNPKRSSSKWRWVIVGGSLAGAVGLSMGVAAAFFNANILSADQDVAEPGTGTAIAAMGEGPLNSDRSTTGSFTTSGGETDPKAVVEIQGAGDAGIAGSAASASEAAEQTKTILGHYPFEEADDGELSDIGGGILLNRATANAFRDMRAAAQADGINLLPLSGFRSVAVQKDLFFGVKAERGQTASERAKVSAPPGHSEHHTGYAVDIGDANSGSTDLSERFETTAAFAWLQENAPYYSFELSFPKGNAQGVNYEPWHWRYVGDQDSLELFHQDR